MNTGMSTVAKPNPAQFASVSDFVFGDRSDIPEEAMSHAALLLIDTLGVAVGAKRLEVGQIARDFAVEFYGSHTPQNTSPLLFDGRRASLPGAAWALATQIDNLDGHDGYNPTKGHIGCAVVPALFAFAERYPGLTGREALQAMVIAYEVATRAAISLHETVSDYHTSGAWNALGVAALGCRLEGATPEKLRHALGIAEYHGPRSQMMREIDNPTMLHDGSGMGAMVGSSAVLLAMRCFTGAPAITVEAEEVAPFWADLGIQWTVALNYIKPYPVCRWAHAAIDALRQAMTEHEGVSARTVSSIEVRTFDEASRLYSGMPNSTTEAQYSLAFALAVMLKHGAIGPTHIAGDGLSDPDVAAIIPKIKVVEEPRHSDRFPEGRWSDIEVVLRDGRRISSGDVHATGGPEAWRTDAEVEEKFHLFCEGVLPKQQAKAIWKMRARLLEEDCLFSELAELVRE
ncbi:MAG: MmgE/PrpD family protein [Pseudomonadota bacterium]